MAQTIVKSGSCGDDEGACNWTLDDKGRLTITGSGRMKNYQYTGDDIAPWGKEITSVQISGITSIGSNAFRDCKELTDIDIPSTVLSIANDVFVGTSLENVTLHEGLKSIASWAFAGNNLKNVTLPESLMTLGGTVFMSTNITSIVLPDSLFGEDGSIAQSALTGVTTIYCSEAKAQQCADWLETATQYLGNNEYTSLKDLATIKTYRKDSNNLYLSGGKWYKNLSDIATGAYIKKRIYTIEEASKVTSEKNSIIIKYK